MSALLGPSLPAIEASLSATRFAGPPHYSQSVTSTSTLALVAAASGTRGGIWLAEEQTAGRGRGGHVWHSAQTDGLYVSALAAPRLSATEALKLSLAAGLAAQAAIAETAGVEIDLRWPNDLILRGKKCGGILVETAAEPVRGSCPAALRYAVIGIGINVNHRHFPPELATLATSLRQHAGHVIARAELLITLLQALDRELAALESEAASASTGADQPSILARFAERSSWIHGKQVSVDDRYTGVTVGLTAEGFLQVRTRTGVTEIVRSGGVREVVRGPLPDRLSPGNNST